MSKELYVECKKLLAKRIESRLKEHKLSRKQFASMMSVQPSTVTKWLSGNHNFEMKTIIDIEWVLNLRIFIL